MKYFYLWFIIIGRFISAQDYIFFSNSDNSSYYDNSFLFSNSPSELLKVNSNKFPVSTNIFHSSTNSLKLNYKSLSNGDWGAAIASAGWIGRDLTVMDSLSFWVYSETAISSSLLPLIYLEDLSNKKTDKLKLSAFSGDISAGVWTNIKIPVSAFINKPGTADLTRIKVIYLGQDLADAIERTIYIDDVIITGNPSSGNYNYIVVLGSSTAAGTGPTSPDSAWVNRFRKYMTLKDTTLKVINLAIGGYTTYNVMPTGFIPPLGRENPSINNNVTTALTYKPSAILINLPSNDAVKNYSISEQIANYDTLVKIITAKNILLWLSTTQPRNLSNTNQMSALKAMRDSTFSRYGKYAVDFWTDIALPNGFINPKYNSGDGVHLNNEAHRILFERMRDAVDDEILAIEDFESNLAGFYLNQNYPNPFNPSTIISFSLQEQSYVKLSIFNILGEKVTDLIYGQMQSGNHQVKFEANSLSSGMYIYNISAALESGKVFRSNRKMLFVK